MTTPRQFRFGRHGPFLLAFALGAVAGAVALLGGLTVGYSSLVAVDLFFAVALGVMLARVGQTPATLRLRAAREDAGTGLIMLITALAVGTGLTATLDLLNRSVEPAGPGEVALALASVPLGWAVMHTLAGFHYAHLYYGPKPAQAGLSFPGDTDPDVWDFLYFAFVIGMTAQVSDVTISSGALRRVVLLHAVAAFMTNTVILALAVNAAIALPK